MSIIKIQKEAFRQELVVALSLCVVFCFKFGSQKKLAQNDIRVCQSINYLYLNVLPFVTLTSRSDQISAGSIRKH